MLNKDVVAVATRLLCFQYALRLFLMNVILTCLLLYFYCKFYSAEVAVYFDYLTAGHKFSVDNHMNVEKIPVTILHTNFVSVINRS